MNSKKNVIDWALTRVLDTLFVIAEAFGFLEPFVARLHRKAGRLTHFLLLLFPCATLALTSLLWWGWTIAALRPLTFPLQVVLVISAVWSMYRLLEINFRLYAKPPRSPMREWEEHEIFFVALSAVIGFFTLLLNPVLGLICFVTLCKNIVELQVERARFHELGL